MLRFAQIVSFAVVFAVCSSVVGQSPVVRLPAEMPIEPAGGILAELTDEQTAAVGKPMDVRLDCGGKLTGRLVTEKGKPMAKVPVRLIGGDAKPVVAVTNAEGAFAFAGMNTGIYAIETDKTTTVVRAWPTAIAPPSANNGLLITPPAEVVRGQYPAPAPANNFVQRTKRVMTNPFVVTGIVATAVAVPVALHNADDDDPSS